MGGRVLARPTRKFEDFAKAPAKRREAPHDLDGNSELDRAVRGYRLCALTLRGPLKRRNAFWLIDGRKGGLKYTISPHPPRCAF